MPQRGDRSGCLGKEAGRRVSGEQPWDIRGTSRKGKTGSTSQDRCSHLPVYTGDRSSTEGWRGRRPGCSKPPKPRKVRQLRSDQARMGAYIYLTSRPSTGTKGSSQTWSNASCSPPRSDSCWVGYCIGDSHCNMPSPNHTLVWPLPFSSGRPWDSL